MENNIYQENIAKIKDSLGSSAQLVIKDFIIGISEELEGSVLYINGLANKEVIKSAILQPLMLHVNDNVRNIKSVSYLSKKYLTIPNSEINTDIYMAIEEIKRGKTLIFICGLMNF